MSDCKSAEPPEFWETADKIECRCGMVHVRARLSTPTDPAAAIIAAAEVLIAGDNFLGQPQTEGGYFKATYAKPPFGLYMDLVAAIRAYRQSRQPQGVKPDDCAHGTRFRFPNDAGRSLGIVMSDEWGARHYRWDGEEVFRPFVPDDRIIPIED